MCSGSVSRSLGCGAVSVPLVLPGAPIKGLGTTPDRPSHFPFLPLLVKFLSSFSHLTENIWPLGQISKCGTQVPGPRESPKPQAAPRGSRVALGCSVSNAAHRGSVFLKCLLSRSSQCELCQGICIPLAFENTHRFKERKKKKKGQHELSSHSIQAQEDGI